MKKLLFLTNKKGRQTEIRKKIDNNIKENKSVNGLKILPEKKKNYILQEGNPVPFLVTLGIMSGDGKVYKAKYDKFRQINKFLEFLDDVIEDVFNRGRCGGKEEGNFLPPLERVADKTAASAASEDLGAQGKSFPSSCIKICDFGCGKSYLTFAMYYYLTEIRKVKCEIEGLDLKEDVICFCNDLAGKLKLEGLRFRVGNIADYSGQAPDIVVTLHACDTATDFALKYAVKKGAKVILSVPCCQHEVNAQLGERKRILGDCDTGCGGGCDCDTGCGGDVGVGEFTPLLKWGIIREKFASLVTDCLRGEWLEKQGYKVQMLEFIDESHTPKNILIRAEKKNSRMGAKNACSGGAQSGDKPELMKKLRITPEIWK